MRRLVLLFAAAFALAAASVAAADAPVHDEWANSWNVVLADGDYCDFDLRDQGTNALTRTRWYEDGVVVRNHVVNDLQGTLTNLETDATATYGAHVVGMRTGDEIKFVGFDFWVRGPDGKLVLNGAGQYVIDRWTGELLKETPKVVTEWIVPSQAPVICAALGGDAAS